MTPQGAECGIKEDEGIRNSIEGKFGQGKRRFSLGRVMTKLPHTSLTAIAITFLVMNICTLLSRFFGDFYVNFSKPRLFFAFVLTKVIFQAKSSNKNLSFTLSDYFVNSSLALESLFQQALVSFFVSERIIPITTDN